MIPDKRCKRKCVKMHEVITIWVNLNELIKQQWLEFKNKNKSNIKGEESL